MKLKVRISSSCEDNEPTGGPLSFAVENLNDGEVYFMRIIPGKGMPRRDLILDSVSPDKDVVQHNPHMRRSFIFI